MRITGRERLQRAELAGADGQQPGDGALPREGSDFYPNRLARRAAIAAMTHARAAASVSCCGRANSASRSSKFRECCVLVDERDQPARGKCRRRGASR